MQNQSFDFQDLLNHLWRVNWKEEGYPFCGIYCVSPDNGWPTKIGISQNPAKRLVGIQTSVWKRVDVVGYRYCHNAKDARQVEKKAHEIFREDNLGLHGEWFDIRGDKAVEVIDFAAASLDIELMSGFPDDRLERRLRNFIMLEHSARYGQQGESRDPVYCRV